MSIGGTGASLAATCGASSSAPVGYPLEAFSGCSMGAATAKSPPPWRLVRSHHLIKTERGPTSCHRPGRGSTFGLEGMFRQSASTTRWAALHAQDADQLIVLSRGQEGHSGRGINERAAFSWLAGDGVFETRQHDSFYIYYSMSVPAGRRFRLGAAEARLADSCGRHAGRTTLAAKVLQHQDGHSHSVQHGAQCGLTITTRRAGGIGSMDCADVSRQESVFLLHHRMKRITRTRIAAGRAAS